MRRYFITIIMICYLIPAEAKNFTTSGDGKVYTFSSLADIDGTNLHKNPDTGTFFLNDSLTIADGDRLILDDDIKELILVNAGSRLIIEGEADFISEQGLTITFDDLTDNHAGDYLPPCTEIIICNGARMTPFKNIIFKYVGIEAAGASSLEIEQCEFHEYNGKNSGTVYMTNSSGTLTVRDCLFAGNYCPAIANTYGSKNNTLIEACRIYRNALNNKNTPQINLVASESIVIRNCDIKGESTLTMVGGIGIANWTGEEGANVVFEDNNIKDCRYGVTTMGPCNVTISGNTLADNNHELNANNGGSGISIYDPYYKTSARIYGNNVIGNLWGITIIGGGDICLGRTEVNGNLLNETDDLYCPGGNIFKDNGNNGMTYDLYNNGTSTIYAQNNQWGIDEQTAEKIESVITHKADDSSLGEVIYMPAMTVNGISMLDNNTKDLPDCIYDLNGVRLNARQGNSISKGLYIIRKNGKSRCCVIK